MKSDAKISHLQHVARQAYPIRQHRLGLVPLSVEIRSGEQWNF
jgi:hypothetical protein